MITHLLSRVRVTLDGVSEWRLGLLTTLTHKVTTFNYSAIADSHTLQFSTAHAKSFQSAVSSSTFPGNGF
jgi:hypothetical protein